MYMNDYDITNNMEFILNINTETCPIKEITKPLLPMNEYTSYL